MKLLILWCCVASALLLGVAVQTNALAALPPLSPTELKEKAGEIFTGKVLSVTSSEGPSKRFDSDQKFIDRTFIIRMGVLRVEKHESLMVGQEVKVRAWQPVGGQQGGLIGFVGPQGHVPIPKKGQIVTVYTAKAKEKPEGTGDASPSAGKPKVAVVTPLVPNGMVLQKANEKKPDPKVIGQTSPTDGERQTLELFSDASSYQFMATLALCREMLINKWDEKVFRQYAFYHEQNQLALQTLSKSHASDQAWGPRLKETAEYQKSVFESLDPFIATKRKGAVLTPQQVADLTQLQREVTAKLGR
jgi:hypothetical protein